MAQFSNIEKASAFKIDSSIADLQQPEVIS